MVPMDEFHTEKQLASAAGQKDDPAVLADCPARTPARPAQAKARRAARIMTGRIMGKVMLLLETAGSGGTEIYVEGMADYLGKRLEVEIVTLAGSAAEAQERFPRHTVRAVEGAPGLEDLLQTSTVPLLVNTHLYSSLLPAVRTTRRAKVPVVATLHMPLRPWNLRHKLRWLAAAALSDACVGVSSACFSGYGPILSKKTRRVVSGPLPLENMPQARLPKDGEGGPFVVAYAGRLSGEKDLPTLIRALAGLDDTHLVLIGEGAQQAAIEELAQRAGVSVEFAGRLPRAALFERLLAADAFVLPSRFEGLGLAAIEAMALGVPTITADFPASAEYIRHGRTGLVFPVGDHKALARQLASLRNDRSLRHELSRLGAQHVRGKFTADAQFGQYLGLFDEMLRRGAGGEGCGFTDCAKPGEGE